MDDRRTHPESNDPELLASLALDDEIDHPELLVLLDAMADDPRARDFWRAARRAENRLDRLRAPNVPRAVRTTSRTTPRRARRRLIAVSVAAVLLVAVGLNLYRPSTESTPIDGAALHVKLGESPGSMSDDRFVELAVELLRADRRYLDEMADLLDDVHNDAFVPETASHARHEERETRFARTETSDRKPSVQSVSSVPAAF